MKGLPVLPFKLFLEDVNKRIKGTLMKIGMLGNPVESMTRLELADELREHLIRLNPLGPVEEAGPPRFSERALAFSALIKKRGFGCYSAGVRELVELIIGEDLPNVIDEEHGFTCGQVVVLINNPNSHNYDLNKPVVIREYNFAAFMLDGSQGNSLPDQEEAYRPTTREDVLQAAEHLGENLGLSTLREFVEALRKT